MKPIKFSYEEKSSHYQHTRDTEQIVKMREDYIEWLDCYQERRYRIFYQDKTWVIKHMTCYKARQGILGHGPCGTVTLPSGKGERSMLCHIGLSDDALLDNCILCWEDLSRTCKLIITQKWTGIYSGTVVKRLFFPKLLQTRKICSCSRYSELPYSFGRVRQAFSYFIERGLNSSDYAQMERGARRLAVNLGCQKLQVSISRLYTLDLPASKVQNSDNFRQVRYWRLFD